VPVGHELIYLVIHYVPAIRCPDNLIQSTAIITRSDILCFGPAKNVTRLPAGTGELNFQPLTRLNRTTKPAGRVPPDALLFAGRQKVSQDRLHLAVGTTVASVQWFRRPLVQITPPVLHGEEATTVYAAVISVPPTSRGFSWAFEQLE
jgi:hypothetical protein